MKKWLKVSEAAQLLDVSVSTLRRYIRDGKLTAYQPFGKGGAIRIWRDDIEKMVV